jgi:hypothetical protein
MSTKAKAKAKAPASSKSKSPETIIKETIITLYTKVFELANEESRKLLFPEMVAVPFLTAAAYSAKEDVDRYQDPTPTYNSPIVGFLVHLETLCVQAIATGDAEFAAMMGSVGPTSCAIIAKYNDRNDVIMSLFADLRQKCTAEQKDMIVRGYCNVIKQMVSLMFVYVMISGKKNMPSIASGYLIRMCATGVFPLEFVGIAKTVLAAMNAKKKGSKAKESTGATTSKAPRARSARTAAASKAKSAIPAKPAAPGSETVLEDEDTQDDEGALMGEDGDCEGGEEEVATERTEADEEDCVADQP